MKDRETCVLQLIGLQRAGQDLLPEKQQNVMQKQKQKNHLSTLKGCTQKKLTNTSSSMVWVYNEENSFR